MCGIMAGIGPRTSSNLNEFSRALSMLKHRGPDAEGVQEYQAQTNVIRFGHQRLSILDLAPEANQPFVDASGCAIVFNGEIYNYLELKAELSKLGQSFRTQSDTEVLLASYREWGTSCVQHFNGMFAFAIWDPKANAVFLARDRFGEKPLFFTTHVEHGIYFASEMKALLSLPWVSHEQSEDVTASFLRGEYYEDSPSTFFKSINRFQPASCMLVNSNGKITKQWRYWVPDYNSQIQDGSIDHAAEKFRELLTDSVRIRLRADVPVGTSLSGGLDSSTLVALSSKLGKDSKTFSQSTFSARFDDDPTLSEGPAIDELNKFVGTKAYSISPDPKGIEKVSSRLHWHQEEPFPSASIYLQWSVMQLARESGVKVLIDGQGADEILAGYQFYIRSHQLDLLETRRFATLLRATYMHRSRLARASQQFEQSKRRFDHEISYSFPQLGQLALRPNSRPSSKYQIGLPNTEKKGNRLRLQLAEALQYNCLPTLLRYADRNSMAFGLEVRLPFLDHKLVEFCISLPDSFWIQDGWHKYVMRKAIEGVVPPSIQWRADKMGYAAPLDQWLRGPLRAWAEARLFDVSTAWHTHETKNTIRQLWNQHQSGAANNSWALWRWISLVEWMQTFRDQTWNQSKPVAIQL
jgi:asparagine synthase (glutamine-hydrolysing)